MPPFGAEPAGGVDLGRGRPERAEDGARGEVAVVGRDGPEQVVVGRRRGEPGRGDACGVGQAVTHVPAVDPDVGEPLGGRRCSRTGAAFPVVLVGVHQVVQLERQGDQLQRVEPVAELVLQAPQQSLDVERKASERAAVGRSGQVDAQAVRDHPGPRQLAAGHRAAGHAVRQRVADRHQRVRGGGRAGIRQRHAQRRIRIARPNPVGDIDRSAGVRPALPTVRAGPASPCDPASPDTRPPLRNRAPAVSSAVAGVVVTCRAITAVSA